MFPQGERMIELADTSPDVNVQAAEFQRLLGYPRGFVLHERAAELTNWARDWYVENGRPWIYARYVDSAEVHPFAAERLQKTMRDAGAHGAIVASISAGPELEDHAQRLWQEEKPDEYF